MPSNTVDGRICIHQPSRKARQTFILTVGVGAAIGTFKLDADRKVVASLASAPDRHTRMPGTFSARYELNQISVSANQEVRGNPQTIKARKVGMSKRIKAVGKEALDRITAEFARWQADVVNYQQFNHRLGRSRIAIGRCDMPRTRMPPTSRRGFAGSETVRVLSRQY